MRNKRLYQIIICSIMFFFLVIGYAIVNQTSLSLTGTSTSLTEDLDVTFSGKTAVSNTNKAQVTVTSGSRTASIRVSDLTLLETVSVKLEIGNNTSDIDSNLSISIPESTEYFEYSLSEGSAIAYQNNLELIQLAETKEGTITENFEIFLEANSTTVIDLKVKLLKVPIDSSLLSNSFTINITATPVEASV